MGRTLEGDARLVHEPPTILIMAGAARREPPKKLEPSKVMPASYADPPADYMSVCFLVSVRFLVSVLEPRSLCSLTGSTCGRSADTRALNWLLASFIV